MQQPWQGQDQILNIIRRNLERIGHWLYYPWTNAKSETTSKAKKLGPLRRLAAKAHARADRDISIKRSRARDIRKSGCSIYPRMLAKPNAESSTSMWNRRMVAISKSKNLGSLQTLFQLLNWVVCKKLGLFQIWILIGSWVAPRPPVWSCVTRRGSWNAWHRRLPI